MIQQPPLPPEVVAQAPSAVPEWLQIAAAVGGTFGGIAGIVGPFAAWAAIRAAKASETQASRSTEAANRALEALGRSIQPEELLMAAWLGPQPIGDIVELTSPTLLRVKVLNPQGPDAAAVSVSIAPASGGRSRMLTPTRKSILAGDEQMFQLADMPLGTLDHPYDLSGALEHKVSSVEHLVTVEYSDVRDLLRWRQVFHVEEALVIKSKLVGHTSGPERVPARIMGNPAAEEPEIMTPPRS